MVEAINRRLTASEYQNQPENDRREELLGGEIVVSPSPVEAHQLICICMTLFLGKRLGPQHLRYEMDIYLTDVDVPRPDIFWIRPDSTDCILIDGYWRGTPDLIIEVLSPSTAKVDRGYKFDLYERCGVREYWIVDPQAQFLEVYNLDSGRYQRAGLFEAGQMFNSVVLGFEVKLAELFEG